MIRKQTPNGNHFAVVEHYARLARKYDRRWDRYTRATLGTLINRLDLQGETVAGRGPRVDGDSGHQPRRILDVACGTGRLEEMVLQLDPEAHITGVDLSPQMIEVARQRIPESSAPNVKWLIAPAEALPVEDDSFDVLTCANAFHLVADPARTLAEFRRVLRPGGQLVIIDWCREYPTIALLLVASRLFGRQYRRIQSIAELSRTIEAGGFSTEHAERFKATWFWGMMCVVARLPG